MKINNHMTRLRAVWHPPMFQGWGKRNQYFEGWYYKLISADQKHALAVIPGISYSDTGDHSFIQTMDGILKTTKYERFDIQNFSPRADRFEVTIGSNSFNDQRIILDLSYLSGEIRFLQTVPYKGAFWSPGIMGWYSFVPFMQCYHGLVSMNHQLEGSLLFENQRIDFTGGKGYIEKDWGSSFPSAWVWTQCNHYETQEPLSVMASVAHIPWLGTYFIGFLAIVYYRGQSKVFTTYTGAKMALNLQEDSVELKFWDKEGKLEIKARQDEGTDLIAPQKGAMTGKVNESLQASHQIIYQCSGDRIETQGNMAGLEVGGNSRILLNQTKI